MIDIVVFGKPRSFESVEFEFDGHAEQNIENSHREPFIKPKDYDVPVLHFFKKGGIATWEVYRYCRGYDSGRDGIVFGVGIKSDKDFDLINTLENLLIPFWEDFANAFLNNNKAFKIDSIVKPLKERTQWTSEDIKKVKSVVKNGTIRATNHSDCLLLAVSNYNDIRNVEESIKSYSDVYIVSDYNLFNEPINRNVLNKEANGKIHVINNGKIELKKEAESSNAPGPDKPKSWNWLWKTGSSDSKTNENDNKSPRNTKPIIIIAAVIIFIIGVCCFIFIKPKAESVKFAESNELITEDFDFDPKLSPERTSTELSDINWVIEGAGQKYIELDTPNHKLKIKDSYKKDKPNNELSIKIVAYLDSNVIGSQEYILGKYQKPKANKAVMNPCKTAITKSWRLDTKLSYDDDTDVSTKISDITFDISPKEIATIGNNNLIVSNSPGTETVITVMAYLDGQPIGRQQYTIAKKTEEIKNSNSTDNNNHKKYYIQYKFITENDWKNVDGTLEINKRNYDIIQFMTIDEKNMVVNNGTWHFSPQIYIDSTSKNPTKISEIKTTGEADLSYWVNNKKVILVKITVNKD